jgi:predicted ATPase
VSTTLLFTDIEGSTRLLHELGDGYASVLAEHRRVLREAFGAHGGAEVDTQGDAFFFTFAEPGQAVAAALAAQRALGAGPVRVRMGVHTGEPTRTEEGWVGTDVHLGARVAAAGHGGQVLLTRASRDLLDGATVRDLGEHRVKDFDAPVWIYQLGDDAFPPLKTISNTNLPRAASSFIGREREVVEVTTRVRESRLVALTGPGGSGKTRLSIEAAAELVGEFKNGVFWVGLATVHDQALVLPTIGQTLGAQGDLAAFVGEREMLLVLDNLEQVVAVAPQLGAVLEACPNLHLLVTSRELLRIRGEVEYEVLPLADPEAVELFSARAQLEPTSPVEELCRRLDNMPLALELAAARSKSLTPEQILDRLGQRLDLFKGGRDVEDRQQTLRATIEWSHDLLTTGERTLFARLGVFAGGCTVESAEAVADADLDILQSLVEKSLLRHTSDRFWMLETIREFAVERLSGEHDERRRRHAEYFLAVAESADLTAESTGAEHPDMVRPELDNIRAAIDWAADADLKLAFRLAIAMEQFWVMNDPFEGVRRLSALLERGPEIARVLRARARRVLSESCWIAGELDTSTDLMEATLAEFEALGDEAGVAVVFHRLSVGAAWRGDLGRARRLLEDSLAICRRLPNPKLEADAIRTLGWVEEEEGNLERALELYEEGAELCEQVGYAWVQASTLFSVAELSQSLGRPDAAEENAGKGLRLAWQLLDRRFIVHGMAYLAKFAAARGDLERAGRLWGAIESEEARGELGLWDRGEHAAAIEKPGDPVFDAARSAGRASTLEDAVEYALAGRKDALVRSGEMST